MVVSDNPYTDNTNGHTIIRTFDSDISVDELVWHRDRRDRRVEILESNGWKFQYDNELPFDLKKGDVVEIQKNYYHRILKGDGKLVLRIIEK